MTAPGPPGGGPDRAAVLTSYGEAVRVIAALLDGVERWGAATPCPEWTVLDLAGHLLAVVRTWQRLLEAAVADHPVDDLAVGDRLAAMNASDLRQLVGTDGAERARGFVATAREHQRRLEVDWGMELGGWDWVGRLTVGQHTGVAIGEYHVHA